MSNKDFIIKTILVVVALIVVFYVYGEFFQGMTSSVAY